MSGQSASLSPGVVDYMLKEQLKHNLAKDPVIALTEDNFDRIVSTSDLILVEFYADWYVQVKGHEIVSYHGNTPSRCVHCQVLEPHFAAAARRLRENDPPVLLGKVKVSAKTLIFQSLLINRSIVNTYWLVFCIVEYILCVFSQGSRSVGTGEAIWNHGLSSPLHVPVWQTVQLYWTQRGGR